MKRSLQIAGCFVFVVVLHFSASAQVKTRVKFPTGSHGTSVTGTVRGYAYRDYIVGASGGQTIKLSLSASNSGTVFTVFEPGGDNLDGATEMDSFEGELPSRGDYVIRVAMMRSAARRKGAVSNYTVKISIR